MQALRLIHKAATVLVLVIGVLHTLGTFYFFATLTERAIWFSGAGLGAIFVAFLNLGLHHKTPELRTRWLIDAANGLFLVWLLSGAVATPQLPSVLVAAIGSTMAVCGLVSPRREESS